MNWKEYKKIEKEINEEIRKEFVNYRKIGRASCRERVQMRVGAGALKKKRRNRKKYNRQRKKE